MTESETLGEFLNRRRQEMSEAEGRAYDEPIPWTELAARGGVHYTNLARWEKGQGMPNHFEDKAALADIFGEEILQIPGMEIDPDMAWVWKNRRHPAVKAELKRMRREIQPQINNKFDRSGITGAQA